MDTADIKSVLCSLETVFTEKLDALSTLDAAIGDGDHGTSMLRGFAAVRQALEGDEDSGISDLFVKTGRVLMNSIGGTCGPLYAMLFIKGGQAVAGLTRLDAPSYYLFWHEGAAALMTLGKASPGEKTMVDALWPAVEALKSAADRGDDVRTAALAAAEAAELGAQSTRDMRAARGRGRYQGDASLGHIDAGAASMAILIRAFCMA